MIFSINVFQQLHTMAQFFAKYAVFKMENWRTLLLLLQKCQIIIEPISSGYIQLIEYTFKCIWDVGVEGATMEFYD